MHQRAPARQTRLTAGAASPHVPVPTEAIGQPIGGQAVYAAGQQDSANCCETVSSRAQAILDRVPPCTCKTPDRWVSLKLTSVFFLFQLTKPTME